MRPSNLRDLMGVYREIMYGLNRVERQIFLLLLFDWTVEDVSQLLRVRRQAIYSRLRGSRRRRNGMIHKNWYVAYWWRRRNHEIQ